MRLKTRIFVAKTFAKKHYMGAMDAMKSLKSDFKKGFKKGFGKNNFQKGFTKGQKIGNKIVTATTKQGKEIVGFAKAYPGLSATTVGLGGAAGFGIGKAIEKRKQKKG